MEILAFGGGGRKEKAPSARRRRRRRHRIREEEKEEARFKKAFLIKNGRHGLPKGLEFDTFNLVTTIVSALPRQLSWIHLFHKVLFPTLTSSYASLVLILCLRLILSPSNNN